MAMMWKEKLMHQKAKTKWLLEGDVKSAFYHSWVNRRLKLSSIDGMHINGIWTESVAGVKNGVFEFFSNHFRKGGGLRPRISGDLFSKKVGNCENKFLIAPFTEGEIKEGTWSCDSNKSPGSDGFSFGFIKENWMVLKDYFLRMMQEFHTHGRIVKGMNPSFITLIPKKEGSSSIEEFRPISLIGSLYKVILKTLANRLSKILDPLISETQSAFIGGRQITDGIVVLNEIFDEAKERRRWAVFKVDFATAYDSVCWDFLNEMMIEMNFCPKWRLWIMECVSTATASVLINGSSTGAIQIGKRSPARRSPVDVPFSYCSGRPHYHG